MLFVEFQFNKGALICVFCVISVLKRLLRQPHYVLLVLFIQLKTIVHYVIKIDQ